MSNSKIGRPTDQRTAILRNLTTALIWNGKIVTTQARAKQVSALAEKLITLAVKEYDNTVATKKTTQNEKNQSVQIDVVNDAPSKLHARRQIMSYLYDIPESKQEDESKGEYKERTAQVNHPVAEKLFRELAPKYDKRIKDKGMGGGYTRIVRIGPRRGDSAEMVQIELI